MRQAGRYLPEYRAIRERHTMLDVCGTPDLAAHVTLQPVQRFGLDAAILFSDLLLPFVPLGLDLEYVAGEGPVVGHPVRSPADVDRLPPVDVAEAMASTAATVRMVTGALGSIPLIGFVGAPFTMASYAVEGRSSRTHARVKAFMYTEPQAWHALLGRLATIAADLAALQVGAGVHVVQVFDSWVGHLTALEYRRFVEPHSRVVFDRLHALGVPSIHFGVGTGHLLPHLVRAGGDVIGVDWRTPLDEVATTLPGVALQGNLDPALLLAPRPVLEDSVRDVLRRGTAAIGHIFNLGHGVLPETPPDQVQATVDIVQAWSSDA